MSSRIILLIRSLALFLAVVFCLEMTGQTQNHISMVKYRSGRQYKIHEGQMLKVGLKGDSIQYYGQLEKVMVDSFKLLLGKDSSVNIATTQVNWLRVERTNWIKRASGDLGVKVSAASVVFLGLGIINNTIFEAQDVVTPTMLRTSAGILGTGLIFMGIHQIAKHKKFKRDKWRIQINNYDGL